jgi:hypothetical protein
MTLMIYCCNVARNVEISESCMCCKTAVFGRLFIRKTKITGSRREMLFLFK